MKRFLTPLLLAICGLSGTLAKADELTVGGTPTGDYRARTIYFLITDRFHPHQPYSPYVDPKYPDATNSVNCFVTGCKEEIEFRKYWGGDIQGVTEKLDYLQNLGISAVWLTPLMENVRAYQGGTGYGTGYHGYWIQNYFRVNEHFGDWNNVTQLSDDLHSHGMRYIQDITLNHSNPNDNHVYGRLFQSSMTGNIFIRSYNDDYDSATGTRYYKHFESDARCVDAKNIADYDWTYWQLHHCLLADLSGYNQQNPQMADYLLNAGKTWIDHGVDDYRLDAIKFPFPGFVADFTRTMRQHLASLQRPAPYFVGEWSHGGVGDAKSLRFANAYNVFGINILDFQLSYVLNQFIGGQYEDVTQKLTAFDLDNFLHLRVQSFKGRDTWQGTFLDNHDQIRTLVRLAKLGITDETEREQRMDLGSVLLMTIRGIPIIYYGDEQYLAFYDYQNTTPAQYVNTGNDDPYNRPGLNRFNEDTPAFKIISTLANLRKKSPAIWRGNYLTVYADNDILMYERIEGSDVVLVAVNRGDEKTVTLKGPIGLKQGSYTGILENASSVNSGNYITVAPKQWTLHLNRLSSLVVHP